MARILRPPLFSSAFQVVNLQYALIVVSKAITYSLIYGICGNYVGSSVTNILLKEKFDPSILNYSLMKGSLNVISMAGGSMTSSLTEFEKYGYFPAGILSIMTAATCNFFSLILDLLDELKEGISGEKTC